MPKIAAARIGGTNVAAFLDMLALSEGTDDGRQRTANSGYDVLVGGALFADYSRHPGIRVHLPKLRIYSTAAGRYQFLQRTWDSLQAQLKLPDFGPESQDLAAVQMLRWAGALDEIQRGEVEQAMWLCRKFWASLPGAGYGQHEQKAGRLVAAYRAAGGAVR